MTGNMSVGLLKGKLISVKVKGKKIRRHARRRKGKGVSVYVQGKAMGTHDAKRKRSAFNGKEL